MGHPMLCYTLCALIHRFWACLCGCYPHTGEPYVLDYLKSIDVDIRASIFAAKKRWYLCHTNRIPPLQDSFDLMLHCQH